MNNERNERRTRQMNDYRQARRMCAYIMPENCNFFMFSQFHITLMCWYTGRDNEKRLQHMEMAQYYNKKMEENNERYRTNWY